MQSSDGTTTSAAPSMQRKRGLLRISIRSLDIHAWNSYTGYQLSLFDCQRRYMSMQPPTLSMSASVSSTGKLAASAETNAILLSIKKILLLENPIFRWVSYDMCESCESSYNFSSVIVRSASWMVSGLCATTTRVIRSLPRLKLSCCSIAISKWLLASSINRITGSL